MMVSGPFFLARDPSSKLSDTRLDCTRHMGLERYSEFVRVAKDDFPERYRFVTVRCQGIVGPEIRANAKNADPDQLSGNH